MEILRRHGEPQPQHQPPDTAQTPRERYSLRGSRSLHAAATDAPPPAAASMQVEQQFSGDGVPALTQTERSNRNARRAVSVLAALMLLLVVVPAILLITPNAFRAGYGVAPHTAIATVVSTAIPPVADTPTPTPTAGPGSSGVTNPPSHPTATPGAQPTATARPLPTATPLPKPTATAIPPTPTATPIPYGASATVTFNTVSQQVTLPPQVQVGDGGPVNATYAHDSEEAFGNTYPAYPHAAVPPTKLMLTLTVLCEAQECIANNGLVAPKVGDICVPQGYTIFSYLQSGSFNCQAYSAGYMCPQFLGATIYLGGPNTYNSAVVVAQNPTCGGTDATNAYYTIPYPMQGCWIGWTNVGNSEIAWLRSQSAPSVLNGPNVTKISEYCSDSQCNQVYAGNRSGSTYTSCSRATGNELSYNPSDVTNYQQSQLQQKVPPGWTADRQSVCPSPSVGPVNLGTRSVQVSCPASERAYYPWTQPQLDALKPLIAGKTESQAQAIIAQQGNGHLDPNSISFNVAGGSYLPTKIGNITITALVP